jgi:hypothetical protein
MAYREYQKCLLHEQRQVQKRREAELLDSFHRGSARVAAMIAEGALIDEVLAPLKLSCLEKMEYVAKNSVLIRAKDGHEAIQVVWADSQIICVHRLLSKEFRNEFQALWLGVWSEQLEGRSRDAVVASFKQKVEYRVLMRQAAGANSEIQFAASPAVKMPSYKLRS